MGKVYSARESDDQKETSGHPALTKHLRHKSGRGKFGVRQERGKMNGGFA